MYYLGYDIGSSAVKVAITEEATGRAIGVRKEPAKEMVFSSPKPGWAEQDPELWWQLVCTATKSLLSEYAIDKKDVKGIGISYQMHGLVLTDKKGQVLRPGIIWCDSRAVAIGEKAYSELGSEKCATHLLNSPANFTASKLAWVKENEPDIYDAAHKTMLPGDYIAYRLSNRISTTLPGLTEGICWDFKNKELASWLLAYYGISPELIPEIVPTFGLQGSVSSEGAKAAGLQEGTPILYRAGDQPNNALSLNVLQPGEAAMTGGTSGVVYLVTESTPIQENNTVNHFAHVTYTMENHILGQLLCINGAGIQYRWLRENLKVSSYEEMNDLAASVPVGCEGLLLFPFGNGAERMLGNKELGTQICNLNLNTHTRAHLFRAALEGIAFSFYYGMELMNWNKTQIKSIRAGDDNLFQSAVFGTTLATLAGLEIGLYHTTGAIGAARACALHLGNLDLFEAYLRNDYIKSYCPIKNDKAYYKAYLQWKNKLETLLNNQDHGTHRK